MAGKKLEENSAYNRFDIDGDGVVSDDELHKSERILELEARRAMEKDRDAKEDAQRGMAWFALFGMLLYPFAVILSVWLNLGDASKILGDMAATYFVSVAAIVAAFYAKEGYVGKN